MLFMDCALFTNPAAVHTHGVADEGSAPCTGYRRYWLSFSSLLMVIRIVFRWLPWHRIILRPYHTLEQGAAGRISGWSVFGFADMLTPDPLFWSTATACAFTWPSNTEPPGKFHIQVSGIQYFPAWLPKRWRNPAVFRGF